jgi:glycolate oxidase iron-sulfur subunit
MTNVQKVTKEPLELLKSIPEVELVEMKNAKMCCGSAGI